MNDNIIQFLVPGDPVAFARSGGNGKVRFTPKKQRSHTGVIKHFAMEAMRSRDIEEGPLSVTVTTSYPIPKSWSKKKKKSVIFKTSKPDVDNLAKLVMDACNGIVWRDDAQIAVLVTQKSYTDGITGTHVKVARLSGEAE